MNEAMRRKIEAGRAIDISDCPRNGKGEYHLDEVVEGKDYCNVSMSAWIWSIGRRKSDGVILAAHDGRFRADPEFECLWLR